MFSVLGEHLTAAVRSTRDSDNLLIGEERAKATYTSWQPSLSDYSKHTHDRGSFLLDSARV